MVRTMPVVHNEEIELYIRTYYSLLRSSAPIRIRSLEETHAAMNSSLHQQAHSPQIDVSALLYSALRLPEAVLHAKLIVMGQMDDVFHRAGYPVDEWQPVRARARRRKFFFEAETGTLAAFVASVSDIDDMIPCLTTLQIEWNKIHQKLNNGQVQVALLNYDEKSSADLPALLSAVREALELDIEDFDKLGQVWQGPNLIKKFQWAAQQAMDWRVTVLGSGLSDYRRSVQTWWGKVNEASQGLLATQPIYFVSSNTHSIVNLLSGFASQHKERILDFINEYDPEGLRAEYQNLPPENNGQLQNLLYYVLRYYIDKFRLQADMHQGEVESGVTRVSDPHNLDVEAQVIELNRLDPTRLDPRLGHISPEEAELLQKSNALILNIDYPLGMAAYHIFSQISTAGGAILGVYILGKAATLNGRVGDVMIPNVVYDEHSRNSYLFRNCFMAQDIIPYLNFGTVLDNQKAITVRGTVLQNRHFMNVFYEEGYTDLEMEAGPYLSAIYEDVYPRRYPLNEIVNLFINAPYDIGLIHYASDTPISRRQTLLSKSLLYFGVDATYATSIAVLRRILRKEIERLRHQQTSERMLDEIA
jgi:hypothetical protein